MKVNESFVISPTQIQNYYNKNKGNYATPEQVRLRMIIIREGSSGDIPGCLQQKGSGQGDSRQNRLGQRV